MKLISFKRNAVQTNEMYGIDGTAIVEDIRGDWHELKATAYDRHVTVYGFAVKYLTGNKVWFGRINFYSDGKYNVFGGRDESKSLMVVGIYDDVNNKYHSKSRGNG